MTILAIPQEEMPDFAALPDEVKTEVRIWVSSLSPLAQGAGRLRRAFREVARQMQGMDGFSESNIKNKFYAWRESGWDWKVFINRAKCPIVLDVKLPTEFIEYWRALGLRNQRKYKPAYRELIRLWRKGEPIPGYKEIPPDCGRGYPAGWSYQNLIRFKPTKFEETASRIGRSAAYKYRPLVFTTRVGLEVGQYYLFDDLWHDHKVNLIGQRHSQKPLEFHVLDLFSGCKFAWGMKPMMENIETGKMERLKECEMRFLLAYVLHYYGYRDKGTTLVVEHGTAAVRDDLEKLLFELTGGRVKVERSGIEGASAFAGQYEGRSKGNFRFKAALETLGNLIHNEMASLPGQVGRNRDECPEELHGRDRRNDALLRAMLALPKERASLLKLDFLEFNEFQKIASEIYERINSRIDHNLEGWVEAGLLAHEWRVAIEQPWLPMQKLLALPAHEKTLVEAALSTSSDLTRARKLSPSEVWNFGKKNLRKLPGWGVAQILGEDLSVERRVGTNGLFEFEDADLGAGEFRYLAIARDAQGHEISLEQGEIYRTCVNPFDPSQLYISNSKGGYIGACARWNSPCRSDIEALHRQMGAARKLETKALLPLATRGADITRRMIEDAKHNAAVLNGSPVTPEEKERARDLRKQSRLLTSEDFAAATVLDEPAPTTEFSNEEISSLFATTNQGES